jgi:hypothetical protein
MSLLAMYPVAPVTRMRGEVREGEVKGKWEVKGGK